MVKDITDGTVHLNMLKLEKNKVFFSKERNYYRGTDKGVSKYSRLQNGCSERIDICILRERAEVRNGIITRWAAQ